MFLNYIRHSTGYLTISMALNKSRLRVSQYFETDFDIFPSGMPGRDIPFAPICRINNGGTYTQCTKTIVFAPDVAMPQNTSHRANERAPAPWKSRGVSRRGVSRRGARRHAGHKAARHLIEERRDSRRAVPVIIKICTKAVFYFTYTFVVFEPARRR